MWIGWIEFDLLLGDVHSLKDKRAVIRPILADLRRATEASVAEVAEQDLHRRAVLGVGVVASGAERVTDTLDRAERLVAVAARGHAAVGSPTDAAKRRRLSGCRGARRRQATAAPSFHTRATSGTPGR